MEYSSDFQPGTIIRSRLTVVIVLFVARRVTWAAAEKQAGLKLQTQSRWAWSRTTSWIDGLIDAQLPAAAAAAEFSFNYDAKWCLSCGAEPSVTMNDRHRTSRRQSPQLMRSISTHHRSAETITWTFPPVDYFFYFPSNRLYSPVKWSKK